MEYSVDIHYEDCDGNSYFTRLKVGKEIDDYEIIIHREDS